MFNSIRHRIAILLIVSVIAVAASVILLPTWDKDVHAEGIGDYVVSDSGGEIGEYSDLEAAFISINNIDGSDFTITVMSDHEITGAFEVSVGKNITLTSPAGETYTLTVTSAVRHFTVSGSLTLENIVLDGKGTGGGIDVKIAGTFTMNDGAVIQNCNSTNGGGVNSAGKFTMNGGVITGCTATNNGGGVYNTGLIGQTSSFTINDGKISNNTANNGGGVYTTFATFTMSGGEISGNTADQGGAVYNYLYTILNLSGGEISGNTADQGGAVYNFTYSIFNLSSGKISGNTANSFGGGVYNYSGATLVMTGGEITNNTTTGSGGGVSSSGEFNLNGGKISENTAITGGGVLSQGLFTLENGEISNNTANNGGGIYNNLGSSFDMSGGEVSGNTATTNGGGIYNYFNVKFTMSGGEVSGNTATTNGGGMYNDLSWLPLIFNISGDAVISNNTAGYSGGGVFNSYTTPGVATINMSENATISNNTAGSNGGGVYRGNLNMTGGEISGNKSASNGGGVYFYNNDTLAMSGDAVISNNTAKLGGGIYSYGSLNITGGTISGNTAMGTDNRGSGGGIYTMNYAMVIVKDGVVFTDNTAPALREYDIATGADMDNNKTADLDDYKNIGMVVLDVSVLGYNAPAYNNYDINYPDAVNAVKVSIVPNEGGTVTVTDSASSGTVYGILVKDGYIYVPASVKTINISAAPADGNAFVQFSVDKGDPNTSDSLKSVPISGEMTIDALFKAPEFTITASADDNSTISPGGDVTVSAREDAKFTFSADPGYKVTAVYVDGEAISSEELASGEYTFLSVIDNHTISVVSEAVVETGGGNGGGTGSGSGTGGSGTGNSNGNGSAGNGGGTDVGGGDIETGSNPSENDNTGVTPVVTETGEWSVISMICAVIAVFAGVIALVAGRDRFRTDDEERRSKTGITLRVLALIIGIVSVIVFFLKEDWSLAPVAISTWTPLIFVLLLATLVLAMVSFRFDKADS